MSPVSAFFIGFFSGALIEYCLSLVFDLVRRKPFRLPKKYTFGKKVSLFTLPIWGLIALLFLKGAGSYVSLFLYSAVIGTILEGLTGMGIHKVFGVRLWTYHHGTIGNFTSLYALPYWGGAGLIFVAIGKHIGL